MTARSGARPMRRPTNLMQKVSELIERTPALGERSIRSAIGGHADYVGLALALLIAEGYVEQREDGRYHSIRAFGAGR
jgi:predicted transcriptional regulator